MSPGSPDTENGLPGIPESDVMLDNSTSRSASDKGVLIWAHSAPWPELHHKDESETP